MLLRGGDGVEHPALIHVVGFLVVPFRLFGEVRHGVDGPRLVAGARLHLLGDRHDAGGGVRHVGNRAGGRNGHHERMCQAMRFDVLHELFPVGASGELVAFKQRGDFGGPGRKIAFQVLREVFAGLVAAALEAAEHEAGVPRDFHAGFAGVVMHGGKEHVHELQRLRRAVNQFLARQEGMQAHRAQTDGAHLVVGPLDRRNLVDAGAAGHVVQHPNRGADHPPEVAAVHGLLDDQRGEVARHVQANLVFAFLAVRMEITRRGGLQNLRAEVAHLDGAHIRNRVSAVGVALEQQVGVAALALRHGNIFQNPPRRDALLADVGIVGQRLVFLCPVDVGELAPRFLE